ncbi:DUF4224 domain-containing protein [Zhongshania sp.]|jgi:hypothetical protein|uniref:DUF4224 domain-containing protein n=1 Tax=Zhongshania sp. TaxID=1971902 RepID=UPI002A83E9F4|nr:DUF4224 domain-containing protein [Zhongshania sp.]
MFLTPEEIQRLTGYEPNQRVRIGRWLTENGYPFTTNRLGDPVVRRSDVESSNAPSLEPNLEWLKSA